MTNEVKVAELSGGLNWYYSFNNYNDYFNSFLFIFHLLVVNNANWSVNFFIYLKLKS